MSAVDGLFLIGVELSRAILTAYSVYAIVVALGSSMAQLPTRWEEWVEAVGGVLYLAGIVIWRHWVSQDTYDLDLFLRAAGSALLVFPRLVRVVMREFR
jgi:hypothetical protein